jgi:hypothetical protein
MQKLFFKKVLRDKTRAGARLHGARSVRRATARFFWRCAVFPAQAEGPGNPGPNMKDF